MKKKVKKSDNKIKNFSKKKYIAIIFGLFVIACFIFIGLRISQYNENDSLNKNGLSQVNQVYLQPLYPIRQ
jgi:hypothetical protein